MDEDEDEQMFKDIEQESMSCQITADQLTQLRFLFDKCMKPFNNPTDPDVQFRANINDLRVDIFNCDVSLEDFDNYFQDYKQFINNVEFSQVIYGLEE